MARYTGALCRLCRREGEKLFLKGDRCFMDKCGVERRKYAPGQHGQRRKKASDYAVQLRAKQKAKETYCVLERQFNKYFHMADQMSGVTGSNLVQLLERRLDNIVYRIGFASNRNQARQLVTHGHFTVNGKRVNIPSYLVSKGDIVSPTDSGKNFKIVQENMEKADQRGAISWVERDVEGLKGKILHLPARDEVSTFFDEQLIVELYSK
ncbi:MAG: 30S ribosomal protein S4 [Nitrospirae bacterium]|nr:30S ribosomal protein S4 [Nitrospirota bacterium]